jgi:FtsH-binding integral membrane protein
MYAQSSLLKFILSKKKNGKKHNMVGGGNVFNWQLGSLLKEKSGFLAAVFSSLIFQLCLVFAIVKFIPNDDPFVENIKKYGILLFIIQIILIVGMSVIPMPMSLKFVLFTLFSAITGFVLKASLQKVSPEIIETALIATAVIFVTFLVFGLIVSGFGIDLGFLALLLFGLLLLIVIVRIVMLFMKTSSAFKKGITVMTLILFSVFIVFDTNQILQRDYDGDFITASLDYFLDVINIFVNLVAYMNGE